MRRKTRSRFAGLVAASLLFHAGVLAVLQFQRPSEMRAPATPPVFEVTIAPVYVVPPKSPVRTVVRPRRARLDVSESPVAPLYAPPAPPLAAPAPAPAVIAPDAALGLALRRGGVGCPNPGLTGLSAAEREKCLERLGSGAKTAAWLGQGLNRSKQGQLDADAAAKARYIEYRNGPIPPGLSKSDAAGGITGLGDFPHETKVPF